MESEPPSFQTLAGSSPARDEGLPTLDFSILPPVYVLSTHFTDEELKKAKESLVFRGAPLTDNVKDARIFFGRIASKTRAKLELRWKGITTEDISKDEAKIESQEIGGELPTKRRRIDSGVPKVVEQKDDLTTDDETDSPSDKEISMSKHSKGAHEDSTTDNESIPETVEQASPRTINPTIEIHSPMPESISTVDVVSFDEPDFKDVVKIVSIDWVDDLIKAGHLLPLDNYLVYQGRILPNVDDIKKDRSSQIMFRNSKFDILPGSTQKMAERPVIAHGILERAQADAESTPPKNRKLNRAFGGRRFGKSNIPFRKFDLSQASRAKLLQQTTSEYEGDESDIPEPPEWVKKNIIYACQRSTPAPAPNDDFINELKKIKLARVLLVDEIGVRAYSTSIASLAAYPYKITNYREIIQLPGCDLKIANLWIEWKNTGRIKEAEEAENEGDMPILKLFWEIWGVGATSAREFLYKNGWRELDDIVEFGWHTLSRVQQIGVKYYDEFLEGIPRAEVEEIGAIVKEHGVKVRDEGIELMIVGGYRRGKERAGDVDMIVSHRDLDKTANLVTHIVENLEKAGYITHTLLLSLHGTHRGQSTLAYRASTMVASGGMGFDTLDKALVVWQDPYWPTKKEDLAKNPKAKNPNVHRRVDIIVSPWRTVGCAITGWSGGTTFQRDLRRYAKNVKGWKFDSSGVRSRRTGEVVALEGPNGVDGSMEDAERAVFEGMALVYREPWERCTG
ncbi:Nucleotidyltransferase [Patellaria atrata CBS 101060]|uniref:DNA-directed DNA polymerase n=1 Tax=Patellaria atrata CBS 101060 TaxID=1346257 RepID=A0A9P4S6Y3_9PEZI|nr:Nucleotidyltransferase [Patellaria atrata CBS 101060]